MRGEDEGWETEEGGVPLPSMESTLYLFTNKREEKVKESFYYEIYFYFFNYVFELLRTSLNILDISSFVNGGSV